MLNILINSDIFYMKNIDKTSIKKIYSIYQNTKDFKYATGFFQPIDYTQFSNNISQFILRENVFFLDVRLYSGETIGIIKGVIGKNDNIVWINSMVIETPYQRMGYGKKAIELLGNYFKQVRLAKTIYLSVFKTNTMGINFWTKCGFCECKGLPEKECTKLNESVQIMCKMLK